MKRVILPLIIISFITAQDDPVDVAVDTSSVQVETIENAGLDFGYKGYQWGQLISNVPSMDNFLDVEVSDDQNSITMNGVLGLDTVDVNYVYSDSGFWKVEINVQLNNNDIDEQIDKFLRIEKNISEVYGNPYSTEQTVSGPTRSYNNFLHVKYSHSFYISSWNVTPASIILLLNGIVQQPQTENSILDGELSFLKLVYYNLDYMKSTEDHTQAKNLPSIYDIY